MTVYGSRVLVTGGSRGMGLVSVEALRGMVLTKSDCCQMKDMNSFSARMKREADIILPLYNPLVTEWHKGGVIG